MDATTRIEADSWSDRRSIALSFAEVLICYSDSDFVVDFGSGSVLDFDRRDSFEHCFALVRTDRLLASVSGQTDCLSGLFDLASARTSLTFGLIDLFDLFDLVFVRINLQFDLSDRIDRLSGLSDLAVSVQTALLTASGVADSGFDQTNFVQRYC